MTEGAGGSYGDAGTLYRHKHRIDRERVVETCRCTGALDKRVKPCSGAA